MGSEAEARGHSAADRSFHNHPPRTPKRGCGRASWPSLCCPHECDEAGWRARSPFRAEIPGRDSKDPVTASRGWPSWGHVTLIPLRLTQFYWRNGSPRERPDFYPWSEARDGWQHLSCPLSASRDPDPRGGGTRTRNCFPESSRLLTSQGKSRCRCSLGGFPATAPSPSHRSGASLPRGMTWTPREQLLRCGADTGPCSTCAWKHCPAASQLWSLEGPRHKWARLKRGVRHLPQSPRPTCGVCWALVVSGLGSPRAGAAFASKFCVGEEDPRHALNDGLSDHMKQNTHRECPVRPDNRIVRSPVQDAATPPTERSRGPLHRRAQALLGGRQLQPAPALPVPGRPHTASYECAPSTTIYTVSPDPWLSRGVPVVNRRAGVCRPPCDAGSPFCQQTRRSARLARRGAGRPPSLRLHPIPEPASCPTRCPPMGCAGPSLDSSGVRPPRVLEPGARPSPAVCSRCQFLVGSVPSLPLFSMLCFDQRNVSINEVCLATFCFLIVTVFCVLSESLRLRQGKCRCILFGNLYFLASVFVSQAPACDLMPQLATTDLLCGLLPQGAPLSLLELGGAASALPSSPSRMRVGAMEPRPSILACRLTIPSALSAKMGFPFSTDLTWDPWLSVHWQERRGPFL